MIPTPDTLVMQRLREMVGADSLDQQPDGQLLQRYLVQHEEPAFEALVRRHGPLVLGVCRRLLHNWHDAEDAFQATFWVLARKAGSITKKESVAGWLYQVAYRAAVKARARAANQQQQERKAQPKPSTDPLAEVTGRELLSVLDEELQRLPQRYRTPLVLCYLEGKTRDEAAQELGWSLGTLKRRLEQGRELLRGRLARRGLALPAAFLAAGVAEGTTAAAIPPLLAATTTKTALLFATGQPLSASIGGHIAELAGALLKTMSVARLKIVSAALAAAAVLICGVTAFTQPVRQDRPDQAKTRTVVGKRPGALPPQRARNQNRARPQQARMPVAGQVVDAAGKPVAGAQVVVASWPRQNFRGGDFSSEKWRIAGQTKADPHGKFQVRIPRPSSAKVHNLAVVASAKGFALNWYQFNPDAEKADTVLKLLPAQVIRGRLVDLQGQPAVGVRVAVNYVGQSINGEFHGLSLGNVTEPVPALWPAPAKTDGKGRFILRGLNPSQGISLAVSDDRFAPLSLMVRPDTKTDVAGSLSPAQIIEGTIAYADTGKPAPEARLTVYSSDRKFGSGMGMDGQADKQGRFRLNPYAGKIFTVAAYPPDGQPYLTLKKEIEWSKGGVKHKLQMTLPRAVLVTGKVTEAGSGKALAGASVQYFVDRSHNRFYREDIITDWQGTVVSGADGVFKMPILPGPGHLLVNGRTLDYIHEEIGANVLYNGKPGGLRHYAHGIIKLDIPAKTKTKEVKAALRRGVTVKGRLLGPDGKPVARALMFCRLNVSGLSLFWRFPVAVRDGRFELHGCDPKQSYPVQFLDPKNKWGKVATLSGKQAGQTVTVRLERCGRARVRFVNDRSEPVARTHSHLEMVITPGVHRYDFKASQKGELAADGDMITNLDRQNYWSGPLSDANGRLTLPALIPGATYRLLLKLNPTVVIKDFTVAAGKTIDLGDQKIQQ
jgi:RNA polymerase sigma factor (sigma-70 family)